MQDRARLLGDPAALSALHFAVWTAPSAHESWRVAIERAPTRARTRWLHPHAESESREAATAIAAPHAAQGSASS